MHHRLPEGHWCKYALKENKFHSRNNYLKHQNRHFHKSYNRPIEREYARDDNIFSKLSRWANRSNYFHIDLDAAVTNVLIFAIFSIIVFGLYTNLDKINEISIWFIPLGTAVFIAAAYYWAKYFFKMAGIVYQYYLRQRNWIRYGILIILAIVAWQIFQDQNIIGGAVNAYQQVNYTKILPLTNSSGQPLDLTQLIPQENLTKKMHDMEIVIFQETNAQRAANGLPPLKLDEQLSVVARDHSQDMATRDYFSHTNLQGEDPTARAKRHGYNVHKELGGGWFTDGIGENIGKMPTGSVEGVGYVGNNAEDVGKAQVNSWMNSPGHRANILDTQYDTIGVGIAYDGLYYFSTQDFK